MIAALFVDPRGCYSGLPDVDPWGPDRDARLYAGPWPVVAHPPCERWGRYASGGPSHHGRFVPGDDGGCFASALASVRRWGGVLEHPAESRAWEAHGLLAPPRSGGWVAAGDWQGWTCCVEQGAYGHAARKPTWLYAVGVDLPALVWGHSGTRRHETSGTAGDPAATRRRGIVENLCRRKRAATPIPFRDVLLAMACTARREDHPTAPRATWTG